MACLAVLPGVSGADTPPVPAIPKLSPWNVDFSVHADGGYKDNVLLSSVRPEASAFVDYGVDLLALRLPLDGREFDFFVSAEERRYLQTPDDHKEQTLLAMATFKREFNSTWLAGVSLSYFYVDQPMDASTTEFDLGIVEAVGHNVSLRPQLRRTLGDKLWLTLEGRASYQIFAQPLDNYLEVGPRLSLLREFGYRSELEVAYQLAWRPYATREQVSADGSLIPDTSLSYTFQRGEFAWRQNWDARRRWRTSTMAAVEINRDNGSGYFNYDRLSLGEQLRFSSGGFLARIQASVDQYYYAEQTISSTDPRKRNKNMLTLTGRCEQALTRKLKAVAEYIHEQSLSNHSPENYRANTVRLGLELEF